ncbi:APC family permease [Brevibacillus migulae]|uniref:APC family permease n=1 Tax=Brevibacillus migulae TaxID=1644114 RepID=UPI00106E9D63|nr:amino acid permease [Brevibacillus migulae]
MENASVKQSVFQKTLSLPQIAALYMGAVVGSGILLIPGLTAELAGPASMIAWLVMSVLVIPMAITMGLLAAKYPNSGGVSHFVRLAFGNRYGNAVGWFFLLAVPIGGPVLAVTGAKYVAILLNWGNVQLYTVAALIFLTVIILNVFGLQLAGKVQTIVVSLIIAIILLAIVTAIPHVDQANMTPFMPHGWISVVQTAGLIFWCFIGWEAVTHLSEEFVDPRKNAIRGVLWSAGFVALLYFGVAYLTVATHSYGNDMSAASLSVMVQLSLGPVGGWVVAVTALFICIASCNAYVSAAARIAFSLSQQGIAPKWFGVMHPRYHTPIGGLAFILLFFFLVLFLLASEIFTLTQLIQLPNATFFATYIGGCLAGIRLLKDSKIGHLSAWISLIVSLGLYPSLGWSGLYPLAILLFLTILEKRRKLIGDRAM